MAYLRQSQHGGVICPRNVIDIYKVNLRVQHTKVTIFVKPQDLAFKQRFTDLGCQNSGLFPEMYKSVFSYLKI